ncbi:MAG: GNAT family N-acetyltransferase [Polyangiaceae bacterium]
MTAADSIRLLTKDDLEPYVAHVLAHDRESGAAGEPPSSPYSRNRQQDPAELRQRTLERWSTPLSEIGWRRAWGLWAGSNIVGSVHLGGAAIESSLHRAELGIGIRRDFRGRGWGRKLMDAALDWARAEPRIAWVDLGVFEGNQVAYDLYIKLGFVERGRAVDRFRVDEFVITDIEMSLRVG